MRRIAIWPVLFAFSGGIAFAQAPAPDTTGDLKKFEGTWVMVSGKKDGQPVAADAVGKSKIVWKGSDVVIETPHQAKEAIKASAKVGAVGGARTMDWLRANGPDAGKTMLAIYEFRGNDEYVIVFAPAGKDRPKDLDAKAGSGHTMHVWKRVKSS